MNNSPMTIFLDKLDRTIDLSKILMSYGIVDSTPFNLLVLQVEDLEIAYQNVAKILEDI